MKRTLMLISFLAALSCHKEQPEPTTCQVKDPLNELGWIKDSVNRYAGDITVRQALYQGKTVFSIDAFLGVDAGVGTLYQCDGSVICKSYVTIAGLSGSCGKLPESLTDQVVIYTLTRR